jgi:amino acid adenylation domain-containing protein
MVIGILGALKAGRAYVPLDPLYPADRIAYMLTDAGASAVVTDTDHRDAAGRLAAVTSLPIIETQGVPSPGEPLPPVLPDAPAYILYTSGSTGRPKGVLQNHRNVLLHIRNYTDNLGIGPDDCLSVISSYSFDAAVMDIFAALLVGATLCPLDLRRDGLLEFSAALKRDRVTVYHSTPTVFRLLLDAAQQDHRFDDVRLVVLGGEQATRRDFDAFRVHFPRAAFLINGLGPTEASVALQCFMPATAPVYSETLPVGHAVDGVEILLLDSNGEDNEVWGEIAIRGRQVALGYWGKPELTAQAFTTDPVDPAKRLYRTGDIGRRLADGSILFLGRRDTQIKLRGHRIELAEVEAVLRRIPGVKQAVAVVQHDDATGDELLVAYVMPQADALTLADLQHGASRHLPSYMVPSAYVMIAALPTTPTGKIDRLALPRVERVMPREASPAQLTELERSIATIWQQILGSENIPSDANFFDLGGHSLLLARVQAALNKELSLSVPLVKLLQYPTIAALANHLTGNRA